MPFRAKKIPTVFFSALVIIFSSAPRGLNAFIVNKINSPLRTVVSATKTFHKDDFDTSLSYSNNKKQTLHHSESSEVLVTRSSAINNILCALSKLFSNAVDQKKIAKLGVAFAITYNFISNINGSITLSVAWYIASKRTGLSPLAVGQWKSLVTAYGGLYVFATLMRPLRFALAVALTKNTENFVEETQTRLGCTRTQAIGLSVSMSLMLWVVGGIGGITMASVLSDVPI